MITANLLRAALFAMVGFSVALGVNAAENQYFVFPIKEIEGLGKIDKQTLRPLVDSKVVGFLSGSSQQDVLAHFSSQLNQAYAGSVVHPKQVRDVLKGPVSFDDNDNLICGSSSTVALEETYAAVIGISRASFYQVARGGNSEILIPITLNLQIIKTDKAKILFSSSNTTYSSFLFSAAQVGTPESNKVIEDAVTKNLKDQVTSLVQEAKVNFSPKTTPVKIVGKEDNFYVADRGFEIGFKEGESFEANDANGNEVLFKVLTASDGYAVLERKIGDVKTGQNYQFVFATKSEDSSKPRVMPVTSRDKASVNAVIDVFTKNIGYKAPFQVAAVDVNFQQTMENIKHKTECVPPGLWEKYKLANEKDTRTDLPQFILSVDTGETSVFTQTGEGGVKSKETFATVVQAKVSDLNGVVYGSAIGVDKYSMDKTAGMGLNIANAKEVSYQNATKSLVTDFLKNITFDPKVYKVKKVSANSLLVENIPVESGSSITATVIRKLALKVGKKDVFVKLPVSVNGAVSKKTSDAEVPFEMLNVGEAYFKPKEGDSLVVYALPKGNVPTVGVCESEFQTPGLTTTFAKPLLLNLVYNSPKYQVVTANSSLVNDVNYLLNEGNFKLSDQMKPRADIPDCFQAGYLIKEDQASCSPVGCKSAVTSALLLRLFESGKAKKDFFAARKSQLEGFVESEKQNFYSVNAHEQFLAEIPELTKKLVEK